jgi:hypothetical protein
MAFVQAVNRPLAADFNDALSTRKEVFEQLSIEGMFFEVEAAVVLDVILNEKHPELQKNKTNSDVTEHPIQYDGNNHKIGDIKYNNVGCIKYRFLNSQKKKDKATLQWAFPLENNISEYPLVNEIVFVYKILLKDNAEGFYAYSRKISVRNFINCGANFLHEQERGDAGRLSGPKTTTVIKNEGSGTLGKYFIFNHKIRPVQRYEGDLIFESRFGSSIRFGSYEDDPKQDEGIGDYKSGYGNPKIIIRNKQRTLDSKKEENKFAYNIPEDINNDGSSIYLTTGKTVSELNIIPKKVFFQKSKPEEQNAYSPDGATDYDFPIKEKYQTDDKKYFIGDQIVMNTDRIVMQARKNEVWQFSKRRFGICTDDEYTVDAHKQIVLTTNTKTVLNSPFIYLGQYDETREPVVLGQTLVEVLADLCDWLAAHVHPHPHSHPSSGGRGNDATNIPLCTTHPNSQFTSGGSKAFKIEELRARLTDILSRRVFVTGGGYAPGSDGGNLDDSPDIKSNKMPTVSIPGGFKGTLRGSGLHIQNWKSSGDLDKYDIKKSERNTKSGSTVNRNTS